MAERTEELLAEAMARAVKAASPTNDTRCFDLPDRLDDARATCTPKGRCMIGWIVADSGRNAWDVLLDVDTGEGRQRKQD